MVQHEKYLYRFVSLFKSADTDRDGIINEDQFKYLIKEMKLIPEAMADSEERLEAEINRLLVLIDPHKTQQITFSEVVTFLTLTEFNDIVPNKDINPSEGLRSQHESEHVQSEGGGKPEGDEDQDEQPSVTLLDKINENTG